MDEFEQIQGAIEVPVSSVSPVVGPVAAASKITAPPPPPLATPVQYAVSSVSATATPVSEAVGQIRPCLPPEDLHQYLRVVSNVQQKKSWQVFRPQRDRG
eukprot:2080593-Amphidinium_carterae.1